MVGCVGSRCCYGNSMMEQTDCRGMAIPCTSASSCPSACTQTHSKGRRGLCCQKNLGKTAATTHCKHLICELFLCLIVRGNCETTAGLYIYALAHSFKTSYVTYEFSQIFFRKVCIVMKQRYSEGLASVTFRPRVCQGAWCHCSF